MGDLGIDTAVESLGDGRYRGTLSKEWEIWGPMGGYVAAVAFRAAGAESVFPRPASFACHYLVRRVVRRRRPARHAVADDTSRRARTGSR